MSSSVLIIVKIPTTEQQLIDYKLKAGIRNEDDVSNIKLDFISLHDKLIATIDQLQLTDAVWQLNRTKTAWRVSFTCRLDETDSILEVLSSKSIGSYKNTYVGILPYSFILKDDDQDVMDQIFNFDDYGPDNSHRKSVHFGNINDAFEYDDDVKGKNVKNFGPRKSSEFRGFQEKFLKSITARLTVAQVATSVKANAELTFDFLIYIVMAAWIAAIGLVENSIVNLVAAMLVSPLMGPVLAVTFGTITRNNEIRNLGIRNSAIGFLLAIAFGFIFGLISFNFLNSWNDEMVFPTDEMKSRGQLRNLWIGTLVALPSGAAVSLSILSGAQSSLIGVAISASLLPPCVNTGLLWAHATLHFVQTINEDKVPRNVTGQLISIEPSIVPQVNYQPTYFDDNIIYECLVLGLVSFFLSAVNVLSMYVSGLLFLKIKEITPERIQPSSTARFFKEDIKIAREYNQSSVPKSTNLGEEILREWADANDLDPNQILSNDRPESRVIQLHTLQDIMADVENDAVFRSVRNRSASISPGTPNFMLEGPSRNILSARSNSIISNASVIYRNKTTNSFVPSESDRHTVLDLKSDIPLSNVIYRRRGSAALMRTLSSTEHRPYSMWPKARCGSQLSINEVPVTPSSPIVDGSKYRRMSRSALHSYEREMQKQGDKIEINESDELNSSC